MNGCKDAQDKLKDSHGRICPTLSEAITPFGHQTLIGLSPKKQAIVLVDYDIAIEVSKEADGKIEVSAAAVNVAVKGKLKDEKFISRMKFSVPIAYPDIAD